LSACAAHTVITRPCIAHVPYLNCTRLQIAMYNTMWHDL
jgi:hypothetical protein